MSPIRLDDEQLTLIMNAARPLRVHQRDGFLRDIAEELTNLPVVGNGSLRRVLEQVQRRHLNAPDLRISEPRSRAY
jgi:hypothetical protein